MKWRSCGICKFLHIFSDMYIIIFVLCLINFLVLNDNLPECPKKNSNPGGICCKLFLLMKYEHDYNFMLSMRD